MFRTSFRDWLRIKSTPAPPRVRVRKKDTGRPQDVWQISDIRFVAYTRSEARALAKRRFGYKDRLPIGMTITKLTY